MTKTQAILVGIQWSIIAVRSGLRDLEIDLFKLSQEPKFHLTEQDKVEIKDFIKGVKDQLKAIETYIN